MTELRGSASRDEATPIEGVSMRDSAKQRPSIALSLRVIKRSVMAACAVAIASLVAGAAGASADTSTGFVLEVTCDSETTTIVSPTSPAAVGQDISSTSVFVLAVGALFAPERFPEGKVVLCDLENLTTGSSFEDLPFLVRGAP
jgi:hypothetical protein